MSSLDKALETQLKNIQTRSGKTLDQLNALLKKTKLTKHGELRDSLKNELEMGHGDANTIVTFYLKPAGETQPASGDDALDGIYKGPKADLRPIHDKLMKAIDKFGAFETAPKKAYVSLRRKKQFAMIGPATNTRVEVGLNIKDLKATKRLIEVPPGGMCQYKVNITSADEVDKEIIDWIKKAYDAAG